MPEVQLNDALFQKIAGWEAVQHARALLAAGKVLSSNWTPPMLKGVVQAGETSHRAGLVINSSFDVDNMCTCRASREDGTICAHSVAVGLHHLNRGKAEAEAKAGRPTGLATGRPIAPAAARDPVKLTRSENGEALAINVIFPPNLAESVARGRAMLVFEGTTRRGRGPLNSLVRGGPFALAPEDIRLLDAAELVTGGDTPGMVQLAVKDFLALLPHLAGHPRLTIGRDLALTVAREPAPLPLRAALEDTGEITLWLKPGLKVPQVFSDGTNAWAISQGKGATTPTLAPLALAPQFREVLQREIRLPRALVPQFLSQDWPRLAAISPVECNFRLEDFELSPQPPKFILNLAGGLAQLTGTLQCAYGPRIMTVGVTAKDESAWLPDPANPRRYSTRDLGAEHKAFMRLRAAGFTGPNTQGQWQLAGQDHVIAFFAREFPRLEREWQVALEERLERSTEKNFERITPEFRVLPSGEQWFDLEVGFKSGEGERFSAADIQQLLRGGGRKLRNGKFALIDSGAVEELQEVLLDCAPQQRTGAADLGVTRYRMGTEQAGFLDATLQEQGFTVGAPPQWREQVRQQTGEAKLTCPPLGALEPVLRPYQKHGVAWLRFLRDNHFGGVLADEMGLGKTLQVLTHLSALAGRTDRPTLVICPTSLVFNWAAEAAKFTPKLRTLALSGPDRHALFDRIPQSDLVITSYALIRRDAERYRGLEFDTVVLDEAQHIKNRQTQNAVAVKSIRSAHRLVLTGTPLENSVLDLWSLYDFLMPGYLGTAADFRERYELPITKEKDSASIARLAKRVKPFLLRRLKRDVAKDLPAKIEQIAWCELTEEQASVYKQLLTHTRKEVMEAVGEQGLAKSRMLVLTALLRLRQVCCDLRLLQKPPATGEAAQPANATDTSGKLQFFGELLDEIVDGGHRVLVFSQFTSMLALLREELAARELDHCYLDGSTKDRGAVVERFQGDEKVPVFLISLKAGGVGLNLTGADTVIHFDPWWNPAVEDQATDRAHRIGQTKVVTNYKLITRGTVEEKILNLQRKKREIIAATLTGEEAFTESLSWDEIQELLG
ncbi:MAG TPA: SNF2-related protein [Candidatus Limnocylindria bacterium]|nr:SNF2-related protein [Candidatus Limnocylindria bacterium]